MSTEAARRVKALERRLFGAANPCARHPAAPVLDDPTNAEIAAAVAELRDCPVCRGNVAVIALPNFVTLQARMVSRVD